MSLRRCFVNARLAFNAAPIFGNRVKEAPLKEIINISYLYEIILKFSFDIWVVP